MRRFYLALTVFVAATMTALLPAQTMAQAPSGPNVQRDCQTIRTCNFSRTGAVRGCLSSFSCKACKIVATRCTLPGGGICRALRCDWSA